MTVSATSCERQHSSLTAPDSLNASTPKRFHETPPAYPPLLAAGGQPAGRSAPIAAAGTFPEIIPGPRARNGIQPRVLSRLVNRLRQAAGAAVLFDDLVETLWGDDPEGGPLDPRNVINQHVFRLRKEGFPIVCIKRRGYAYQPRFREVTP